jgi:hypothetical protein
VTTNRPTTTELIAEACAPLWARIAEIERHLVSLGDRAGIPVRLQPDTRQTGEHD